MTTSSDWWSALVDAFGQTSRRSPEAKRIRELEREVARKDKPTRRDDGAARAPKKTASVAPGGFGGLGRRHGRRERQVILELIDEAVSAGARRARACEVAGLDTRTVERWRKRPDGDGLRHGPTTRPASTLTTEEEAQIVEIATAPEFVGLSPTKLADMSMFVGSESTVYRVLRLELDPLPWTHPERRILCPTRWQRSRKVGARSASSRMSSRRAPCAWS